MDAFAFGRWVGEVERDMRSLEKKVTSMSLEMRRLRRAVLVFALWSMSATGMVNHDLLSSIIAQSIARAVGLGL